VGTVLGGLLLPQLTPFDLGRTTNQAINAAGGMVQTQTSLLALQEAQRAQEAQALARQYMQHNPGSILGGGGGPMGSAPALPGGGPMPALGPNPVTQQTFGPGGVGPVQPVPGGQDLSRFAGGTPPGGGPVLAGGGQANPLEALMRQNPDAALMIQKQQQAQEDLQLKRQEQRLTMGEKVMEYLGRSAQGVKSQADLDAMRAELERSGLGQYAAQLPQVYSKEAMQAIVDKATSVKESLTLQTQELSAQAAMIKAKREGISTNVNELLGTLNKTWETASPQERTWAVREAQQAKVDVSAAQGSETARIERTEKPLEGEAAKAVSDLTTLRTMTDDLAKLYKPEYAGWQNRLGIGGAREKLGAMDEQEASFRATALDIQDMLGRLRSGAVIPPAELRNLERLAPGPNTAPELFTAQLQRFQRALEQTRESRLRTATTGRGQLREETRPTTPRVGEQPTSQPSTGPSGQGQQAPSGGQTSQAPTGAKVVSRAELHAEARRRNISPAQAEQMATAKGYTVQ
jgi:hypothetical protein